MKSLLISIKKLFFLAFLISYSSFGQQFIQGRLSDIQRGEAVSFASIQIKGNPQSGTISNEDGYFELNMVNVTSEDSLQITHINYRTLTISMKGLSTRSINLLTLVEERIRLEEIEVRSTEDVDVFEEVVSKTRQSLTFPKTAKVYYRESVKENSSFNKFADGMLTVSYENKNEEENSVKLKVDQCRVAKLPKDDNDEVELVSILKIKNILSLQFVTFLNRFRNENQRDYHFYAQPSTSEGLLILIEPKKEADRANDQILYRATIRADRDRKLSEIKVEMDSLSHFEKSLLGLTYEIIRSSVVVSFKVVDGHYCVAFARSQLGLKFTTKKFEQSEDFVSQFLTLSITPAVEKIARDELYNRNALYKHGDQYSNPFWAGLNFPVFTEDEQKLIDALAILKK